MQLRSYQKSSIMSLREAFKTNKRVLFVLATGGGKTAVFTAIAQASKKRILILAHRKELIDQIQGHLGNYDTQRITVGMVQTIAKRGCEIEPEFIIIDEAHHAVAGSWNKITERYPAAYVLGVTATPCRLDGKGLAAAFDVMVEGVKISELISMGYLCGAKTYASQHDLSKIKSVGGDYHNGQLMEYFNKSKITGDAITSWRKYANDVQTIVFCINIKHAEIVMGMFNCLGHKAAVISSKNSKEERAEIVESFKTGKIKLLISVDIISEGFDVPECGAVILLRPTKSLSLYMQQVGRALRTSPGKTEAIILDHAGNCFRHGIATQDREWELTTERVKEASKKWDVKHCGNCYAIFPPSYDKCPECGHVIPPKPKEMKLVAGELVPIEEVELKKKEAKRELAGEKTLADWLAIAKQRGYAPGWAYHRFNARLRK
jgi:superfamily II DNA or RNA helicase